MPDNSLPDPNSLLEPEFHAPFTTWKADQTPENSAVLLKSIRPVLTSVMRQFSIPDSPTLQTRAKIMAIHAMKRYDPSKAKLRTFLHSQLQGLRRHTAKETQILAMPEQVGLDAFNLNKAENELRDNLGRDPSDLEIADHIGMPLKRIAYVRKAKPGFSESFFHRQTDEGEDYYAPAVQAKNGAVQQWHELVYHDLAPIDQLIMEHTLGLHSKRVLQNKDLARKLRISPGAISQRKARIQQKLDLRDELSVF